MSVLSYLHDNKARAWWRAVRPELKDEEDRQAWVLSKMGRGAIALNAVQPEDFRLLSVCVFHVYLCLLAKSSFSKENVRKRLALQWSVGRSQIPDPLVEVCFLLYEIGREEGAEAASRAYAKASEPCMVIPTLRGPKLVKGPASPRARRP